VTTVNLRVDLETWDAGYAKKNIARHILLLLLKQHGQKSHHILIFLLNREKLKTLQTIKIRIQVYFK
jgi:hypothetical protein